MLEAPKPPWHSHPLHQHLQPPATLQSTLQDSPAQCHLVQAHRLEGGCRSELGPSDAVAAAVAAVRRCTQQILAVACVQTALWTPAAFVAVAVAVAAVPEVAAAVLLEIAEFAADEADYGAAVVAAASAAASTRLLPPSLCPPPAFSPNPWPVLMLVRPTGRSVAWGSCATCVSVERRPECAVQERSAVAFGALKRHVQKNTCVADNFCDMECASALLNRKKSYANKHACCEHLYLHNTVQVRI